MDTPDFDPISNSSDSEPTPNSSDVPAEHDSSHEQQLPGTHWDSDEALEILKMERSVRGDESNEQMTRRMIEEAAPVAAQSIIHLAMHSTNDNTRLKAATYITDKLLDPASAGSGKHVWEDLVGEMVAKVELQANKGNG